MRRHLRHDSLQFAGLLGATTGVLALGMAGCSSGNQPVAPSTSAATSATTTTAVSEPAPLPAEAAPPGSVGVSPGGVTTRVDVPSDATESQYGQACHAAKVWMDEQHTDPQTLVEPYLKVLQTPGPAGPGTFNTPWAQLTPAQQAGVIIAVTSASNGECG
jgi:hypothetical protein